MIKRLFGPISSAARRIRQIRIPIVQQWAGIALISTAGWLFSPRAGLLTAGIFVLAVGAIGEADRGRRKD